LLADLAREHTAEAIQTLVQLMKTGAGNSRVMAANSILDRGWGKPAQTTTTTMNEKRSALDWTTDELVAFLNEHATDGDGAPEEKKGDHCAGNNGNLSPTAARAVARAIFGVSWRPLPAAIYGN